MNQDVTDLYAELGIRLAATAGADASTRCFAAPDLHQREDRNPSASVNLTTGAWICHACGARGGAYDAALLAGHTPRSAMDLLIRHRLAERRHYTASRSRRRKPPPPASPPQAPPPRAPTVTRAQIESWHQRLLTNPRLVAQLWQERAISPQTLERFRVGFDGARITIPITGADDTPAGLLRWKPFHRGTAAKLLALPGTRRQLFPAPESIEDRDLLICEGEPDALAADSAGIPSVAIPGVASWRPEWASRFKQHTVTIVLDCDTQGRRCSARIALDLAGAGIDAVIVDLDPGRNDGYDLTDHLTGN